MTTTTPPAPWPRTLGTVLCRIVVPAWIFMGATFKLVEADPSLIPKFSFLIPANNMGIDLDVLLATLIGLEFFAVAVMVFLPRLARLMAIFMLTCFCAILTIELVNGASSCGCLGDVKMPPWLMLIIDGGLLVGVLTFGHVKTSMGLLPVGRAIVAGVLALALGGFGAYRLLGQSSLSPAPVEPGGTNGNATANAGGATNDDPHGGATTPQSNQGATADPPANNDVPPPMAALPAGRMWNPNPAAMANFWFADPDEITAWEGKSWKEAELVTFMQQWPTTIDEGEHFVVFYGRTCDHCEEMFYMDFAEHPELAPKVVAVQVPDEKDQLTADSAWDMPADQFGIKDHFELPVGANWIITTPLVLRIEDGIVTCAREGDHSECMGIEGHEH